MITIRIEPFGWEIDGSRNASIMDAALMAGVILPRSCQSGACRTCVCKMEKGKVSYPMDWPGLLKEEKKAGMILPCVAMPDTDVVIYAPAARLGS